MEKFMSKVEGLLHNITTPILIIQGDNDPIVKREKVTSTSQRKHGILADNGCNEVFEAIYRFIGDHEG